MTNLQSVLPELLALPLFAGVSSGEILQLCDGATVHFSKHREVLLRAGEPAMSFGVVLSGAYKLCRPSPSGEDVIMHFSTVGDVIAAFIMSKPEATYPVSAISMGASQYLRIPRENYINAWAKNQDLVVRIQALISIRMGILQDQKVLARAPLTQKIAALLLNLLEKNEDEHALVLPLPLTRREIADTLGSSVESVIRVMSEWSKQGLLETTDQNIKLLQPSKIIEILKHQNL